MFVCFHLSFCDKIQFVNVFVDIVRTKGSLFLLINLPVEMKALQVIMGKINVLFLSTIPIYK